MFSCFCISKTKKNHHSIKDNSLHYNCITKILKEQQIQLLELIYEDLSSRHSKKLLSYENFLSFFDLKGLWGSKLFHQFDKNRKQLITGEEFLYGICMTVKASFNEKIKLIYNFFDGNITDGITFKQFIKMLYNYSKPELKEILLQQGVFINEITIQPSINQNLSNLQNKVQLKYQHQLNTSNHLSSFQEQYKDYISAYQDPGTSLQIKTVDVTYQIQYCNMISLVRDFAKYVFKKYNLNEKEKLSFELFKSWISIQMKLFKSYFHSFHQDIWQHQFQKTPKYLENSKIQKQFSGKLYHHIIEGQDVYVMLVDGALLICKDKKSRNIPFKVICLAGLTVTKVINSKGYGMIIKHIDIYYQQSTFYFENQKQQQQWLNRLSIYESNILHLNYNIGELLGTGKFSVVYKCHQKETGKKYALKVINKKKLPQEAIAAISNQRHVMEIIKHPQIINYKQTILTNNDINLIIQYIEGQDLFQYVRKYGVMQQHNCAFIIGYIIKAVMHLHSLDIIHRDLKPENIMVMYSQDQNSEIKQKCFGQDTQKHSQSPQLNRNNKKVPPNIQNIKIIDFGLANHISQINMLPSQKIAVGTPNYIAPQILMNQKISFKADNFAIGSIMYYLIRGKQTFYAHTIQETLIKTVKGDYEFEGSQWNKISTQAKDLIQKLLLIDAVERIQLEDALNHPWFRKVCKSKNKQMESSSQNKSARNTHQSYITLKKYRQKAQQVPLTSDEIQSDKINL